MKYAIYPLAVVVALSGLSLGVASAANENGLPGVVEKLDEIKTVLLGLSTTTASFPTEMDVSIVSPDPIDVNIVGGGGESSQDEYFAVTLLKDDPLTQGDEFLVENIGSYVSTNIYHRVRFLHSLPSGCSVSIIGDYDGIQRGISSISGSGNLTSADLPDIFAPNIILRANNANCNTSSATINIFTAK